MAKKYNSWHYIASQTDFLLYRSPPKDACKEWSSILSMFYKQQCTVLGFLSQTHCIVSQAFDLQQRFPNLPAHVDQSKYYDDSGDWSDARGIVCLRFSESVALTDPN